MAARSLGTLTLDLVAKTAGFVQGMDKAQRESEKWKRKVKRDVEVVSKRLAALSVGAVAALGAITANAARTANEVNRLSQVAGTSTREFQRYAAGAKLVGIEQEKLADIFKDTNDKVGDFLQTGGGPLKDFFENIAPQIGVTAEQFKNLSGPQALELYVSTLEKANVSQAEMIFYMEAIANDATLLLPLLKNNAAGFTELGDAAERAGAIMDDDLLRSADELNAQMLLLKQQLEGAQNQIAAELLPVLSDLAGQFIEVADGGSQVSAVSEFVAETLKRIATAGVGASTAMQILGKSIGGTYAIVTAFATQGLAGAKEALNALREDLESTAQVGATRINAILSAGEGGGSSSGAAKALADAMAEARKQTAGTFEKTKDLSKELRKIEVFAKERETPKAIEEQIDLQKRYNALVKELRTDEEVLSDQLQERLDLLSEIAFISEEAREKAYSRIAEDAFSDSPQFGGLAPEVGGAFGELAKIEEARAELDSWYDEQLAMLETYREEHAELNAQWDEREAQLAQEHADRLSDIEFARQQAALVATEDLFGNLAGLTREFAGEQSTAYQVLFAVEKAAAIARSIIAIQTAIAQASASGPFPANLAAMASVASATAGLISTIASTNIQGQAHDGLMSVPSTGTYLLEKGERVTTAETSAKMDSMIEDAKKNGGNSQPVQVRNINVFDANEVGNEYMGSSDAEQAVMNIVSRNRRTMRSLVG